MGKIRKSGTRCAILSIKKFVLFVLRMEASQGGKVEKAAQDAPYCPLEKENRYEKG